MDEPIVITLVIDPKSKKVSLLSTEIKKEHLLDCIQVLRGLEDNLFNQLNVREEDERTG